METFINIAITIVVLCVVFLIVVLVHEIGHYFVARVIMKQKNAYIVMGFFGPRVINAKRFKLNLAFFFGGYVGGMDDDEPSKYFRLHMALFFAMGGIFTILLAVALILYLTGGNLRIGDFFPMFPFLPSSGFRTDLWNEPIVRTFINSQWLSLSTPLEVFNMFIVRLYNITTAMILVAFLPYAYRFKKAWNPSDIVWVFKYAFNLVSEKDEAVAFASVNEK